MNDAELDQLIAAANPASDRVVATLPLSVSEAHLLEEIMATDTSVIEVPPPRPGRRGRARVRARARWLVVPVISAAALLIGVVGIAGTGGGGGDAAWAAPLLAIANGAPRYLVDAGGWKVTRADEFAAAQGEMTFSDGRHNLELRWQPVAEHDGVVTDRKHSASYSEPATVTGDPATLFQYDGTTDFTTLWRHGDHSLEARAEFATIGEYRKVLGTLHVVDADTWLRAMPDSVIKPTSRASVVDEMLADMPKPPGFDASALRTSESVQDRYQLGAAVSSTVACGWINSWIRASGSGDTAAVQTAVAAMNSSHDWAVLHEMNKDGDYPEVLWEYADAMRTGAGIRGGKTLTIAESYKAALGCT
jgi:hypothetical protein